MRRAWIALWLAACAPSAPEPALRVAAAASLSGVVSTAATRWSLELGQAGPRCSFAATSTLARQIEAGAEYDVFLSANAEWVASVQCGRSGAGPALELARNSLVLVVPASSDGPLDASLDRLRGRRWTTADPSHVPLGAYARAALEAEGLWEQVAPNLVATRDARAALRLVELGEVDWGVVYRTDALASRRVDVLGEFSGKGPEPACFGVGLTPAGQAFLEWLVAPGRDPLWLDLGFVPTREG